MRWRSLPVRKAVSVAGVLLGAAALTAAAPTALATVDFVGASGVFYHFGSASIDGQPIVVIQEPSTTAPISFNNGDLAFSASSEILPQVNLGAGSLTLTLAAAHTVAASVEASVAGGHAEAGAGLSQLYFDISITDLPALYTGDLTLQSLTTPDEFPSGSIIPPGEYAFFHLRNPFEVHAYVSAVTGQSSALEDGLAFSLQFTTIPAPAAAAPLLLAAATAAAPRRRRPNR